MPHHNQNSPANKEKWEKWHRKKVDSQEGGSCMPGLGTVTLLYRSWGILIVFTISIFPVEHIEILSAYYGFQYFILTVFLGAEGPMKGVGTLEGGLFKRGDDTPLPTMVPFKWKKSPGRFWCGNLIDSFYFI